MRNKLWICLVLILVIPGLMLTVSCSKKTVKSDAAFSEMPKSEIAQNKSATDKAMAEEIEPERKEAEKKAEMERLRKLEEERLKAQQLREAQLEEERRQAEIANKEAFLTELVLYDFESSVLTPIAQDRLRRKAEWLRQNPNVSVTIEGHCDERGSTEYNLVLGEKRSEAAKAFLVDMGISPSQLTVISYGEERPFVRGHDESAWSMNRRAHFVIE